MTSQTLSPQTVVFRVEIWPRENNNGQSVDGVHFSTVRLYFLLGVLDRTAVDKLCRELLADPVTEVYSIDQPHTTDGTVHAVDVTLLPGVTDAPAANLVRAAHLLGIAGLSQAATGTRFLIQDDVPAEKLAYLATHNFCNPVIQRFTVDALIDAPFVAVRDVDDTVEVIALKDADDETLVAISQERRLSLNLDEMAAIRGYFHEMGREPTDVELEMLAQTWSEHCVHKTFKAEITYEGPPAGVDAHRPAETQHVDGLLNDYLRAATDQLNKSWVHSAFVDNAGIVRFDEKYDLAFKVETHNRPSAIEPFGGANTGVGGVVRDVLGVSAKPIANTDVLCFGPPDLPADRLPQGVLETQRVAEGVIAGVEDYGNKMGIPTVNGAILYHDGYISNPLVFCGCLGILPRGTHRTGAQPGDYIVVIGGRTGRDGLRGATFSSMEMDTSTSVVSGGAVQIGNPIEEKQVQEVVLLAREAELYSAITDCGAGGLSSAVGEMGEHVGATVQLETVPLKYPGLRPWEIWLSEAQERMVLAVPPEKWSELQAISAGQDVEAVVIGTFEATGRLTLLYGEKKVGEIHMDFLHDGLPRRHMQAVWQPPAEDDSVLPTLQYDDALLKLLALPNIRSKEDVVRRYDHEVQGGTAVKPLAGVDNHGPADGSVLVPIGTQKSNSTVRGVALASGINPLYGELDPYAMAWASIDEAMRNAVAVGGDPDQTAILDNFCWGNTALPDRLGALVRCGQGCYDAAMAYGTPFVSGKDSLNNEYLGDDGQRHAIPGTLLISAMSIVPDVTHTATSALNAAGNLLVLVGETRDELGGSHLHQLYDVKGGTVPQPIDNPLVRYRALHAAMQAGLVESCHDCSEGGLAVTLAEMCIGGRLGAAVTLPGDDALMGLFSETAGRLVVEVKAENREAFGTALDGVPLAWIGTVTDGNLMVKQSENIVLDLPVQALEQAWRGESVTTTKHKVVKADSTKNTVPEMLSGTPRVLILHANGTNRDHDAALACELAGGAPEIVHINQLLAGERSVMDYHMVVVPGGFSYGDDLGAGALWALDLREQFGAVFNQFIAENRPVIGICNGFQTLVKAGLLPGEWSSEVRGVTLTYNQKARFECRWVYLQPNPESPCVFTQGIDDLLYVPVAHGEGRFMVRDGATADKLHADGLIALTYVDGAGNSADYPTNPNGSAQAIAGICNPAGNVFGLMPHPENHVFPWQHPRYHRGERGMSGLRIFENAIRFAVK